MPETPITVTNAQLARLAVGLASLDGWRPKPDEYIPFQFAPETTWKIASNSAIIAASLAPVDKAKKTLAAQYQITDRMQITPENMPRAKDFMEALAMLEEKLVDVSGLEIIAKDKLNLGYDPKKNQNQIAPSVLVMLMPILGD